MYVSKLAIQGVRGFSGPREVDLGFARPDGSYQGWTVLTGPNGSGKTTLLQAIALGTIGDSHLRDLTNWNGDHSDSGSRVGVTVEQGNQHFELGWNDAEGSSSHTAWPINRAGARTVLHFSPGQGRFLVGYGAFRRLSPVALTHRPTLYDGLRTLIADDMPLLEGVNWLIAQHLHALEQRPGAADPLEAALAILADGLLPDDHRVVRVDSDGLWLRDGKGDDLRLQQMSEGHRTLTALVTDIMRQLHLAYGSLRVTYDDGTPTLRYPGVVLVDGMENHLHIGWQKKIGDWLKTHFPLVQFIVTTHSPYVCQSADPNGLIALPAPNKPRGPYILDQDLYQRVVLGSGDDAILTELFGMDSPYSRHADDLRRTLGDLEEQVLSGSASPTAVDEFRKLSEMLKSSLSARVDEVSSRF